ncbi:hypothetical protein ACLB2K_004532 [Fragaria x ananassa]
MIEDGKSLFNSIKAKFEVEPEVEHYACMVDLYGKAGELEEAEKLIQGMPYQPDVVVWCALLGACGLHSSLELGKFAAKELDKLESDHPAIFSTLSRIQGERGVWNSVLKLRKTMKEKGVQKQNAETFGAVCGNHYEKVMLLYHPRGIPPRGSSLKSMRAIGPSGCTQAQQGIASQSANECAAGTNCQQVPC